MIASSLFLSSKVQRFGIASGGCSRRLERGGERSATEQGNEGRVELARTSTLVPYTRIDSKE